VFLNVADKRVLLKDIAEKSGLTINTVSRALKNRSDISIGTREYIQKLALDMGYIPDVVASSLRSGFTKTIGIMFDNISNPYYMIMTELIHNELKKEDYDIMIFTSSGDRAQFDLESFNKMVARRIDGIITFLKPTPDVVKAIHTNRIPLVILGREGDDIGIDSIYTNDYQGGYEIGKHLAQQGHQKIGYIGAPQDILCSLKRLEGLRSFLDEKGIVMPVAQAKFLKHYDLNLIKPVEELIEQKVTAIFCFNDTMAYEVISILNQKGLSVPKDIAVAGYDNIEQHLRVPVSLTTIDTYKEELTSRAIQTLMHRMHHFDAPLVKLVNGARIIIRKTA
jgi:LacI family transcriptional regulator